MRLKIMLCSSLLLLVFGWGYLGKAEGTEIPEDVIDGWKPRYEECTVWCSFGGIPFECDGELEKCLPDPNRVCSPGPCGPA